MERMRRQWSSREPLHPPRRAPPQVGEVAAVLVQPHGGGSAVKLRRLLEERLLEIPLVDGVGVHPHVHKQLSGGKQRMSSEGENHKKKPRRVRAEN